MRNYSTLTSRNFLTYFGKIEMNLWKSNFPIKIDSGFSVLQEVITIALVCFVSLVSYVPYIHKIIFIPNYNWKSLHFLNPLNTITYCKSFIVVLFPRINVLKDYFQLIGRLMNTSLKKWGHWTIKNYPFLYYLL